VVEHLPNIHKIIGLIPSIAERKKNKIAGLQKAEKYKPKSKENPQSIETDTEMYR
jgi:hypothetical protein